ncbi:MarR family winged helix-turn-helix transcriptional regulator [Actinokineospora bangkokensis]|uniref:MarR family transcriptional regulator n=1 Tax=Actinokineospora bangkokensis TaxID=1193682 RepID=A0A1Q9LRB3_9PSEU|nr:MarR family transcriptional regulator [Actinokineospora bangkokensis]OLR94569.1 MarR family transcriptional regulator [Actinokineospora bangkokensis]
MTDAALPGPAHAGPTSHAIFRVARLHRTLAARLLREVGLHPGQETLLMHLWDSGPLRQADLVPLLGSDSATVTRMVARLEQAGYVRRSPWPGDRRATRVEPTAAGSALRPRVEAIWAELERRTLDGVPEDQRAAIRDALATLERGLTEQTHR